MINNYKMMIHDILNLEEQSSLKGKIADYLLILLIFLNVIAVIIEPSIRNREVLNFLRVFETVSVIVFTIEYVLRIWVSDQLKPQLPSWKARLYFVFSIMALIDLVAILPFYIPFIITVDLRVLRILRVFRLLRLFKANRYTSALSIVVEVIRRKKEQLLSSLFVAIVLIVLASVLMYNVENAAQPDVFKDVFSALWWAVSTLTTVRYGDIYPITLFGKALAAFIAILGIGIVAIPTGIIASGFTEIIKEPLEKHETELTCPNCGFTALNDKK